MRLVWIVGFSLLGSVGAIALAGLFLLSPERTRRILVPCLISYATGTLLGAAFWGLIPHAHTDSPATHCPTSNRDQHRWPDVYDHLGCTVTDTPTSKTAPLPSTTPVPVTATRTHLPLTSTSSPYRFLPAGPAQPDPPHPCPKAPAYIVGRIVDTAEIQKG